MSFDAALASRRRPSRGDWPVIPTQAGHDAGILQAAGIPTAMLFVRNPTGVSHSPAELGRTCRLPGRRDRARRRPRGTAVTRYLLERAWVGGAVVDDVVVEIEGGRFTGVGVLGRTGRSGRPAENVQLPRSTGELRTASPA